MSEKEFRMGSMWSLHLEKAYICGTTWTYSEFDYETDLQDMNLGENILKRMDNNTTIIYIINNT